MRLEGSYAIDDDLGGIRANPFLAVLIFERFSKVIGMRLLVLLGSNLVSIQVSAVHCVVVGRLKTRVISC